MVVACQRSIGFWLLNSQVTEFTLTDFMAGCKLRFNVARIGTLSSSFGPEREVSAGEFIRVTTN